jgi:hypothetical protein
MKSLMGDRYIDYATFVKKTTKQWIEWLGGPEKKWCASYDPKAREYVAIFIDNENFFSIVSKKSRFYLYANVEAELCELDESEKLTPADLKEGLEAMTSPAPEGAE